MGGRPLVLPLPLLPPLLHAEDTTFAPCLLLMDLGFDGVIADFGSPSQKVFRVDGVMADCG